MHLITPEVNNCLRKKKIVVPIHDFYTTKAAFLKA